MTAPAVSSAIAVMKCVRSRPSVSGADGFSTGERVRNMERSVAVLAPGKINLALQILGRREDGFHLMEMVMQSVDLADRVMLTLGEGKEIRVQSDDAALPIGEDNLAVRCARAFFRETGLPETGIQIVIEKNIPMEAGIAGGSADGAAVLVGLNHLLEAGLSRERLCGIGVRAGADIPFCIIGATALALGIGDRVIPLPPLPECFLVIAKPEAGMSTPKAFRLFDEAGGYSPSPYLSGMMSALRAGSLEAVCGCMHNAFEARLAVPEVEELKRSLLGSGAMGAVMTGSGTAVIGLFLHKEKAEKALKPLKKLGARAWVSAPVNHGAKVVSP